MCTAQYRAEGDWVSHSPLAQSLPSERANFLLHSRAPGLMPRPDLPVHWFGDRLRIAV